MASTPVIVRSTNSTKIPRPLLTAFNLSASVRFPDGPYGSVHAKRLLEDLKSTLGEERASPPIPTSMGVKMASAVGTLVTSLHSYGQNTGGLSSGYRQKARSFELYAIMAYLETRFPALESGQPREKERREYEILQLALADNNVVKSSKDGRDKIISTVREYLSRRQWTEITPELAHDLMERVQSKENTPGKISMEYGIGGESTWVSKNRIGNPFASPKLGALVGYIGEYNKQHHTSWTLLDVFIAGYRGEAKVAGMLSLARLSCIYGREAQQMEKELFEMWLRKGLKIVQVVNILLTQITNDRPWLYIVKDPLKRYILAFSQKYSAPEQCTAKILNLLKTDVFSSKELLIEAQAAEREIEDFVLKAKKSVS
uniref:LAGLIDADG endonuclease n=1 Tax=Peronospora matthiolae TaxID=2874970 RepID=A0AAV1SZ43_9STRA